MNKVDKSGAEKLLDGGDSAADTNIFAVRGDSGAVESGVNAVGDEMKCGAARYR